MTLSYHKLTDRRAPLPSLGMAGIVRLLIAAALIAAALDAAARGNRPRPPRPDYPNIYPRDSASPNAIAEELYVVAIIVGFVGIVIGIVCAVRFGLPVIVIGIVRAVRFALRKWVNRQ